jgi:hypothetical protein
MTCPPYHTDPPTMPNINGILIRRDDNWTLLALGHHDGPAIEAAGAKLPLHEGGRSSTSGRSGSPSVTVRPPSRRTAPAAATSPYACGTTTTPTPTTP